MKNTSTVQRHRRVDFDESKNKAIPNESFLRPISASIKAPPSLTKTAALRGGMKAGEGIGEASATATATAAEVFEEATDFHKIRNFTKRFILRTSHYVNYDKSVLLSLSPKLNTNEIDEDDVNNDNEGNNSDNNLQNKILRMRHKCGLIVKHRLTQNIIILLLLVYAILLGAATYPTVRNNPQITSTFNYGLRKMYSIDSVLPEKLFALHH